MEFGSIPIEPALSPRNPMVSVVEVDTTVESEIAILHDPVRGAFGRHAAAVGSRFKGCFGVRNEEVARLV